MTKLIELRNKRLDCLKKIKEIKKDSAKPLSYSDNDFSLKIKNNLRDLISCLDEKDNLDKKISRLATKQSREKDKLKRLRQNRQHQPNHAFNILFYLRIKFKFLYKIRKNSLPLIKKGSSLVSNIANKDFL